MWRGVYVAWLVCTAISAINAHPRDASEPLNKVEDDSGMILAALEFINEKNDVIGDVTSVMANKTDLLHQTNDRMQERTKAMLVSMYRPRDCKVWHTLGYRKNAVYRIFPLGESDEGVEAWCDMTTDGGGWTVFLTRQPQDSPVDFAQTWRTYVHGFGNASGEYWLGNRYLHALTQDGDQVLRLDIKNTDGATRFAEWNSFSVGNEESKFILRAEYFSSASTLGNVLQDQHTGHKFSTVDQDNDAWDRECSPDLGGGGWWYKDCRFINPTAPFTKNRVGSKYNEAHTYHWDGDTVGGRWTAIGWLQMKIRSQ